jgi:hypothetical protein
MIKPTIFNAVSSLVNGAISGSVNKFDSIIYHDDQTPPTKEEAETKLAELIAEYDAQEYARNRKAEYPDYGTQLNKIYDDGIEKWKSEMVDPIKAKYPKPE